MRANFMKILVAESCKKLFFMTIVSSVILNILIHLIYFIPINTMVFLIISILQLFANLVLGIHIRKKNKEVLQNNQYERKYYARITLIFVGIAIVLVCFPDIIAMFIVYVGSFLYERLGIDHWFSEFDLISMVICLSCVFFPEKKVQ